MSDTPRTDSETWRDEMDHVDTDYTFAQSATVSADFARQIERELAEAKFDLQFRRDLYALQSKELAEARQQRDELAKSLQLVWNHLKGERIRHDYITGTKETGDLKTLQEVCKQALAAVKGGAA